ncbi:hypothetical protein VTO42DRAFT_7816 [Malbranchea cinnamomea]
MPSITTSGFALSRRKRVSESESDDEEHASRSSRGGTQTPFSQTPDGSKRVKLSSDTNSEAGSDESSEGTSSPNTSKSRSTQAQSLQLRSPLTSRTNGTDPPRRRQDAAGRLNGTRLTDEHRPGAIVRVKLSDFVTYTSAEFFPGPRLNMVIGPNGTGKSTLVCAICLGLGWPPHYLGRAKDPGEFVKHGCEEATIEIELKGDGRRFRANPVICRFIKREGNKSTYTLNGEPSSQKQVREIAQFFSIQVDNLCQFLPQDRVAEFAALTPVQLLQSTQRAAAGQEMIDLHENLKALRAEQKRVQVNTAADKEELVNLENRQEMQREDVERMKQRAQIKKRIEYLQMARPLPYFKEVYAEHKALKERHKALVQERNELQRQLDPVLRAVNDKKDYHSKLENAVKHKKRLFVRGEEVATESSRKMGAAQDKLRDLDNQIEAEKKSVAADVEQNKKLQQNINKLKRQIEEGPPDYDPTEYSEKIRDCTRRMREMRAKAEEVQSRKRDHIRVFQEKNNSLAKFQEQLRSLHSQTGLQEEKLKRMSQDTLEAWNWIKEHQDRFENRVYGPPLVECSVTHPQYADALESLMQRNDFLAFTTQSRSDFRTLQRILYNELRLHDVTIKTCSSPLSQFHPPVSNEELRALGFDGWARDYLTGPEPVLAMLCSENRLHQTPLVLRDISDDEYKTLENSSISTWVAGGQNYQVLRRREYGAGAISTRVRPLRPARAWTDQPIDAETIRELEGKIDQAKREMQAIQAKMEEDRVVLGQLKEERDRAEEEKRKLEHEKSVKQTALTNFNALPTKLAQQEEKLQAAQRRIQQVRNRIETLRNKQDEIHLEEATAALEYAASVDDLRRLYEDLVRTEIKCIEASSDYEILKERNSEVNRTLEEKNAEVAELAQLVTPAYQKSRRARDEADAVFNQANQDPELRDVLNSIKDYTTVAQLEADIDSEKARLELTGEGSSTIIQEFEQRQHRIDELREKVAKAQKKLDDLNHAITEVRGQWEPRLDALVQKISDAFSDSFARIGCAGQVSVDKATDTTNGSGSNSGNDNGNNDSDFDQWSIKIEVKFREHESLSVLDAHRQSGGERAVSTIFYLMALQSLSASPFRVVDEINQGMDPRNERMVHERMVDIACGQADSGDAGGQYFLITPKLLSGLVYKRGMKVLCIASGEYMPEDYSKLDFRRCILRRKDILKQRERRLGKGKERMVGSGYNVSVEA